jgi:zona occludens toxin (predicted ATPase)
MNRTGLFLFIAVVILAVAAYWYYTNKMNKPAEGTDATAVEGAVDPAAATADPAAADPAAVDPAAAPADPAAAPADPAAAPADPAAPPAQ